MTATSLRAAFATILTAALLAACSDVVPGKAVTGPASAEAKQRAADRDAALHVAERGALAVTRLDYRDVDRYWADQAAVVTADLRKELEKDRARIENSIRSQKLVVDATVWEAALSELDDDAATALAVLTIRRRTTEQDQRGTFRLVVKLAREDGKWLVSDVSEAPGD